MSNSSKQVPTVVVDFYQAPVTTTIHWNPARKRYELQGRPVTVAQTIPTGTKLAETLEVSPRTAQRDIDFMRGPLGIALRYNRQHIGWTLG